MKTTLDMINRLVYKDGEKPHLSRFHYKFPDPDQIYGLELKKLQDLENRPVSNRITGGIMGSISTPGANAQNKLHIAPIGGYPNPMMNVGGSLAGIRNNLNTQ